MRLPWVWSWTWKAGVLWALATFFAASTPPVSAATNSAETFVQENIDKGYFVLNDPSLSDDQRHVQFRNFMLSLIDVKRIGLFTLGRYANVAPKADIDAFTNAFTDYVVAVYESRLSRYKGQTFKVTASTQRATDDVVVDADVVNPNAAGSAPPIKAAFRVRNTSDGKPIITDIQVEGIWLALAQRSDFTGFLQEHGGRLTLLIDSLKMQTERGSADNPG
jgi:phospholipid transport system substrate-binding protein